MRAGKQAGLRLGAAAFAAGAVLGPLREGVLAPALGGLAAALLEGAVLAALLWWLAGVLLPAPLGLRDAAVVSATALAVVLLAEAALGWLFAVTGLAAARAPRGLAEQAPGFVLLAWLAALPFLRGRA